MSGTSRRADNFVPRDEDPRADDPVLGDERATLAEYLRFHRLTLELKCRDLDAEAMARRSVPPSTMSLLGLVRHMAAVERYWFRHVVTGLAEPTRLYCSDDDRDGDFDGAVADPEVVAEAWATWREQVAFAECVVAEAPSLDETAVDRHGRTISLREVLVHMVEEYARHNGHADLLRECIDGRIGQ